MAAPGVISPGPQPLCDPIRWTRSFLITNDDGIDAPGIAALTEALEGLGEVMVSAPHEERSGCSHAITFHTHLRAMPRGPRRYAVTGTTVDSVYVAMHHFCPRRPALVCSGINRGYNLGTDVFYSGTAAGAAEGYLKGVPALALSCDFAASPRWAIPIARCLAEALLAADRPYLLNVNVPAGAGGRADDANLADQRAAALPAMLTRLGVRRYRDTVIDRMDPHGRSYYWIGGPPERGDDEEGDDSWAVANGIISITPLEMDISARDPQSAHALLERRGILRR